MNLWCGLLDRTMTPGDCMNKVNLEQGVEPGTSWLTGISQEKSGLCIESRHRKELGGTWRLQALFDLGDAKRRSAGPFSASSLTCQVFTPISDSQVFTGNGTTKLDTASLEDVWDSNHSIDPCLVYKEYPRFANPPCQSTKKLLNLEMFFREKSKRCAYSGKD